MEVALIIIAALVAVGLPLYLLDRKQKAAGQEAESVKPAPQPRVNAEGDEVCCGQHTVCEKDSLLATVSEKAEYYDDEELDRFAGRRPDAYTDEEIEEFRDVLLTLMPSDIAGWGRSLQLRGIQLPACVREELLLIVSEQRM